MALKCAAQLVGDGVELDSGVQPLGIFSKDDKIDVVAQVERVPRIGLTRPQVGVQVEQLP